jgi:hypothetical protein
MQVFSTSAHAKMQLHRGSYPANRAVSGRHSSWYTLSLPCWKNSKSVILPALEKGDKCIFRVAAS